jgi:hypothetical protein
MGAGSNAGGLAGYRFLVAKPLDQLADLWRWFAEDLFAGSCPIYAQIARSVAEDRELLALQFSALPHAHFPPMLLAGAHYLLLDGGEHPLAAVYSGRSTAPAPPLFRDLCLGRQDDLLEVLNARTVQTNEVGRSALLGPALTWAAGAESVQLVDVGCSAGLNLLCDRFRLDYGPLGATGPQNSLVRIDCTVSAGAPPIAPQLPLIAGRLGIDLDPPDLVDSDDTRWLLACIWPGTGRFDRAARAFEIGRTNPPPTIRGDALDVLPGVLDDLGDGRIVVLNSWSYSYFPVERRQEYVELLAAVGRQRPVAWLVMDMPGLVEWAPHVTPPNGSSEPDVLTGFLFNGTEAPQAETLAFVQSHGLSMSWLSSS